MRSGARTVRSDSSSFVSFLSEPKQIIEASYLTAQFHKQNMLICCITGKYDLITVHKVKKKNDHERVALSSPIEMIEVLWINSQEFTFYIGNL